MTAIKGTEYIGEYVYDHEYKRMRARLYPDEPTPLGFFEKEGPKSNPYEVSAWRLIIGHVQMWHMRTIRAYL